MLTREKLNELLAWLRVAETDSTKLSGDHIIKDNQIAVINLLQNAIDEKIGDLAKEFSAFTNEQTYSMTKKQRILNTAFFNQLVLNGIILLDDLTPELEKIRVYYGLNQPGVSRNMKEDFDAILGSFVNTGDYYAGEFVKIALQYILRYVGTRIRFGRAKSVFSFSRERIAVQKLVAGERRYFIGIGGRKTVIQSFNDGIQTSFDSGKSDTRYSALLPFLNCITNIFQCLIMQEHEVKFIDRATVYKYSTIFANDACFVLPLYLDDIQFDIVIGYGVRPNFATIAHNI
jgi:hypothetical protein